MRKNIYMAFLTVILLVLGACSAEPAASEEPPAERIAYDQASIIQVLTDDLIVADGTYHFVTSDSDLSLSSGSSIEMEDIKTGDLAFIYSTNLNDEGEPNHSLVSMTVLDDDLSNKISRAVVHLMDNQEIGEIISPEIKSVNHQLVTVQFKDSRTGQLYESIINLDTFSFHIQPIGQIS